MIELYLSCNW